MSTLTSISMNELVTVTGGGLSTGAPSATFEAWVDNERAKVAEPYKSVVCISSGPKGALQFASGFYGDKATNADKIRAGELIQAYCFGGSKLPNGAPPSPF